MSYGFKLGRVDVGKNQWSEVEVPSHILKEYIGGSGLGIRLLCDEAILSPDHPHNPLLFLTGPFTGTAIPTSGRHHIVSRSPQTGLFGEADVGGSFGDALKRTGFDGLMIVGAAKNPCYLKVEEGNISMVEAPHLWGLDTYDVTSSLKKELGKEVKVSCIGPAAENNCLFAGIFHDGVHARTAARCGLGTVMASKRVKAIAVVKGKALPPLVDRDFLREKSRELRKRIGTNGAAFRDFGTSVGMVYGEEIGDLPIKNWLSGSFKEGAENLSGQKMTETILTGRYACTMCPIGCGRIVSVERGPYAPVNGGGPEYESSAMLGPLCLIDNLEAIAKANELCNRYGIDTIDAGACVSFAMECYEKGLLTSSELGGPLEWGDAEGMIRIIHLIGKMEGIGALLGQGVGRAAEELGEEAKGCAIHVKNMAVPAHDPRCYKGMAVGYATSPRGGCHLQNFTYPWERSASWPELGYESTHPRSNTAGKGLMNAIFQNAMSIADSLKICKFAYPTGLTIEEIGELLHAITGWEYTKSSLLQSGERIFNLKRLYNVHLGGTKALDTLPERLLSHKRGTGGSAEDLPDLETMLKEYYIFRGWDKEGVPKAEKLEELSLSELGEKLLLKKEEE